MKRYKTILLGCLAVSPLFFTSCEKEETLEGNSNPENNGWVLVWSDEFNTPTEDNRPDPSKWTYELGASGFGNDELQNYTNKEKNASYTTYNGEGCLKITALKDGDGATYSSARIKTEGLFEIRYGRIEARLILPYGPGLWPAFWMLGNNYSTEGWPGCGEIDIMENKGYQPNIVSSALHMPGRYSGNPVTQTFGFQDKRFDTDFHVFAIEWDETKIDFFVDDILYKRVNASDVTDGEWVFDHPFFIILNVAVGGTFGGKPTDNTTFPQTMYIDYVRAYKKNDKTLIIVNPPSENDGNTDDEGGSDEGGDTDEGNEDGDGEDNPGGEDNPDDEEEKEDISSGGSINDWNHNEEDKGRVDTDIE